MKYFRILYTFFFNGVYKAVNLQRSSNSSVISCVVNIRNRHESVGWE